MILTYGINQLIMQAWFSQAIMTNNTGVFMHLYKIIPIFLMSSVLVACGGSTGASLSAPTTATSSTTGNTTTTGGTTSGTTSGTTTGTGSTTGSSTGTGTTTTVTPRLLARNVVDAEYSDALERLVTVSSSPDNALNIINPTTGEQQAVILSLAPTSVALSPDGKTAVVGHKGAVTHVDLQTSSILKFHNTIGFEVFDIVLGNDGMAYADGPTNLQWGPLYAINLATGAVQNTPNAVDDGSHLQIVPSLNALYAISTAPLPADLERYSLSVTPPTLLSDSPYHGEYEMGSNLWLTEGGDYILTAGATLFRTGATQDEDMLYQRGLSDSSKDIASTLLHADHSQEAGKVVVIQDKGIAGTGSAYSLKTYTMPQLTLVDEKTLTALDMDKSGDAVIPQFAFFNSDGSKRYAVLKQGTGTYLMTF